MLSAKLKMTEMKLFPFLSLSLCRSGSLKARLCSTWSAASAWTVRPRRALWSSRSVAPRWPASPGSHKSSPEPQRTGGKREREEERGAGSGPGLQKDSGGGGGEGDHICTLSDASPRGGRSENCTSVMSTSSSPAHRVSVTRASPENVTRPHRGLSVYSASSLSRMLQFFYVI